MSLSREKWEEIEAEFLAPYALKSRDSRGRDYPEDEHAYRSRFQRDRDRIIHTTAFRRLEYKTQVFVTTEGDYYRTRLTHTIEVAQIGRSIARALMANEDLTEAICLAHDLGHGPFGHAGEGSLHQLMADHGGFDHNHQSLRIVEKLENRFPDFRGLNLTWEVREGIIKHETEYDKGAIFAFEPEKRGTLECQIVNAADEIAYTTADLDDGLRSGMLSLLQLRGLTLWEELLAELDIKVGLEFSDMDRHRIIRRLIGWEVTDLIAETERRLREYNVRSVEELRSLPENAVSFSPVMAAKNRELKNFLLNNLYRHYRVMRMQIKARRFLSELFNAYIQAPVQLPQHTQARLQDEGLYRVVCDHIAGMTDRYATQEHRRLFDPGEQV
jgi:dGTPase